MPLERWQNGDPASAAHLNQVVDALRRSTVGAPPGRFGSYVPRYLRIVSATEIAAPVDQHSNVVRWTYIGQEVVKIARGYSTVSGGTITTYVWADLDGGYEGFALNLAEEMNTGVGIQGNGIDHDGADYIDTFQMQPCPVGRIVRFDLRPVPHIEGGQGGSGPQITWVHEAVFDWINAEDGTCS